MNFFFKKKLMHFKANAARIYMLVEQLQDLVWFLPSTKNGEFIANLQEFRSPGLWLLLLRLLWLRDHLINHSLRCGCYTYAYDISQCKYDVQL